MSYIWENILKNGAVTENLAGVSLGNAQLLPGNAHVLPKSSYASGRKASLESIDDVERVAR